MLNVTDADIPTVLEAPQAALYFWSPSCGYCRSFGPIFEELAAKYEGRILMAKANVQEAPQAAATYQITGVPTVVFLKNGQVVRNEVVGGMSKPEFEAMLLPLVSEEPQPAGATQPGSAPSEAPSALWPILGLAALGVGAYYALDLKRYF